MNSSSIADNGVPLMITDGGVTLFINSKPYVVSKDHSNFELIMDAVRNKNFNKIPGLINKMVAVADKLSAIAVSDSDIVIDIEGGIVTCRGSELPSTLATRMIRMVEEGFDIAPLSKFITNLFNNPSSSTVEDLYTFLEHGQLPITDDGFFVAYKKIKSNWTDCYTGKVLNQPASTMTPEELAALKAAPLRAGRVTTRIDENGETEVYMLRRHVDDRSEQTCSYGLHFCSYDYLKSFGGQRVVAVKVNPADVVSIPADYNSTKGRCSKYVVLSEITGSEQTLTEKSVYNASAAEDEHYDDEDISDQNFVDDEQISVTIHLTCPVEQTPLPVPARWQPAAKWKPAYDPNPSELAAYAVGYKDGRTKLGATLSYATSLQPYYDLGYKHGRGKQRKLYRDVEPV